MDNRLLPGPLLKLHWYDALAEQLVQRHRNGLRTGTASLVIGSHGSGTSMSRNHVAKYILESTDGPVAIVFTAPVIDGTPCYTVVVSREGGRGTPVLGGTFYPSPGDKFVSRYVGSFNSGNTWCLADVSGEVAPGIHECAARHVVYFTSNDPVQRRAFHHMGHGAARRFWVPKPQLEEAIAWFELCHNDSKPASDTMKSRLKQWMVKYGHSLWAMWELVRAKEDWQTIETQLGARLARQLFQDGDVFDTLVLHNDTVERIGADAYFSIKSTFSATNPVFHTDGFEWRSRWVKDQVYRYSCATNAHIKSTFAFNYKVVRTSDIWGRLLEDFILAQFRVTVLPYGVVFTFLTTTCGGIHTRDNVGLTNPDGTLPAVLHSAVPSSDCLWFRDIGKWDRRDLCPEVAEIQRVMRRVGERPVLLIPYNPDYPGLDGVLLWQRAGVWKALLIQVTLSPRHAASAGGAAVIAFWIECLAALGVHRDNMGVLFCPKPEDHPYPRQRVGDLGVAQYSMSWTTGTANGTRKRRRKHKRTPAEAVHGIDECLRDGGVEVSVAAC